MGCGSGVGTATGLITSGAINRALTTQQAKKDLEMEECKQGGGEKYTNGTCHCPKGQKWCKTEKLCIGQNKKCQFFADNDSTSDSRTTVSRTPATTSSSAQQSQENGQEEVLLLDNNNPVSNTNGLSKSANLSTEDQGKKIKEDVATQEAEISKLPEQKRRTPFSEEEIKAEEEIINDKTFKFKTPEGQCWITDDSTTQPVSEYWCKGLEKGEWLAPDGSSKNKSYCSDTNKNICLCKTSTEYIYSPKIEYCASDCPLYCIMDFQNFEKEYHEPCSEADFKKDSYYTKFAETGWYANNGKCVAKTCKPGYKKNPKVGNCIPDK